MNWKNRKFDFEMLYEPTVLTVKNIYLSFYKKKIERGQVGEWAKKQSS